MIEEILIESQKENWKWLSASWGHRITSNKNLKKRIESNISRQISPRKPINRISKRELKASDSPRNIRSSAGTRISKRELKVYLRVKEEVGDALKRISKRELKVFYFLFLVILGISCLNLKKRSERSLGFWPWGGHILVEESQKENWKISLALASCSGVGDRISKRELKVARGDRGLDQHSGESQKEIWKSR